MKRFLISLLAIALCLGLVAAQTPVAPQKPDDDTPDEVLRITTELVQTDVVVVDDKDQIIPDLKIEDFELYDNGKKQDVKFLEFVSVDTGRRTEGNRPSGAPTEAMPVAIDQGKEITAKDVKRIVAFVIDDLTIPVTDLNAVRQMLLDFVNNKMKDGDLVAVVRVVGGKGLLQQFTSDRVMLRRAIAAIKPVAHPFKIGNEADPPRIEDPQAFQVGDPEANPDPAFVEEVEQLTESYTPTDEINQFFRGLSSLATASFVIESLKEVPGHKNMVIISGGIPIFSSGTTGSAFTNTTYMLNRLSDAAIRAGVVISALDPRGMRATPGVVGFSETPGRSNYQSEILGRGTGFGRGGAVDMAAFGPMLAGGGETLGLATVANLTGGVAIRNTNDLPAGLDKIMARSNGYYVLAYTPINKFDKKFHKLEVKVRRGGAKVYHHHGYLAREDKPRSERTKEELIVSAARSPLAKSEIDVTPNVGVKLLPENKASLDIHMRIDAKKLQFVESGGRYRTSFDVVGFVLDQLGQQRGGFSETVNLNLTKENYQQAINEGLVYSNESQLPPGYYQLRSVVREASTGNIGTFSKYFEIPDLKKGRLAASSLFLFGVDKSNTATPLLAVRNISRQHDLRYAVVIHNAKMRDGKPQINTQLIISQGNRVLLREPEQPLPPAANSSVPLAKVGQFGISKMQPGRYTLTLVITDPTADKKAPLTRSLDFTVVD
ncbi:MAG TPA: VWA domain-containing protein [Pyrinomonadaceae bacterium]|nr:VWA domain-containing protein [Pyrinomonadaceae bacterium]